ncbi:MAG: alkaline phosphatase family protein [Acidobacteria bacterium]|nr:alkaline phosphatase family protein [Acidobacteriota bacterium]MCB9399669.1 alkaline phosphatase family protein [Acidobacteriota bacterium]
MKWGWILCGFALVSCGSHLRNVPADPAWAPAVPMQSAPLHLEKTISKIGFGSCFNPANPGAEIWDEARRYGPDVFLLTGDNVYQEEEKGQPELLELRKAYAELAALPSFRLFRQQTPLLVTWDDHDFGLNDAGASWKYKDRSMSLFRYVWALPATDPQCLHDGVYSSKMLGPIGKRVQIILLDTRYFRSDWKKTDQKNAPGKERYVPDADPTKTLLGDEQWAWLEAELRKPAQVRLLVSSIQIIADGHGFEAWRMLPLERQRLYRLITETRAEGVVFLSGDRHFSGYYRETQGLPYPITELTSSPLNIPVEDGGLEFIQKEAGPKRLGSLISVFNFGVVEIDWTAQTVTLGVQDIHGNRVRNETLQLANLQTP